MRAIAWIWSLSMSAHKIASTDAGWSSSVARWAHNPEVVGSNPAPATSYISIKGSSWRALFCIAGSLNYLMRSELVTTSTLLAAMAAAAYKGESNPAAAIGRPITL
jgi:hypothetical protein